MPAKKPATKKSPPRTKSATKSTTKRKAAPKDKAKAKAKTTKKAAAAAVKAPAPRTKTAAAHDATSPFKNFIPYSPKKNEAYMGAPQLEHFRGILLRWRQELMEEVDRTVVHMQDEAANFPDPTDRAAQEEEFNIELKTRDRERRLIKKINQTIDRIDQDDYGYCDTCGVEIGLQRLEARPTANQCVDCKSRDELRERQLHG